MHFSYIQSFFQNASEASTDQPTPTILELISYLSEIWDFKVSNKRAAISFLYEDCKREPCCKHVRLLGTRLCKALNY